MKKALITGITGQDGSYLAEFLLAKGYEVHGLKRRASSFNSARVDHLYRDIHEESSNFRMHYADMTDTSNLVRLMQQIEPDEVYNLAAQSHVQVSFECPEYTAESVGTGVLRLLEAMRILGMKQTRFYQASTSELFGLVRETPQSETTPFYPRSPYGCAKLYAYWIVVNYRESYGMHASNGILFNHESPRRGETFVTRKITMAAANIAMGMQKCLYLGNLNAKRDWGFAGDYVDAMWRMLRQETPGDYVIATGKAATVRDFATLAFARAGITIDWKGTGIGEIGIDRKTGNVIVRVDPRYFRPAEVDLLLGDASKAQRVLGWTPRVGLSDLVNMMVDADLARAKRDKFLRDNDFNTIRHRDA